jgi:hypothetical protein
VDRSIANHLNPDQERGDGGNGGPDRHQWITGALIVRRLTPPDDLPQQARPLAGS